ncbi:MAG: hypothetical protein H8E41_13315 [Desulfobulbaceae bacterium]|uniref:Uncharacterized protein n=1 Tax=Candidatus Desulfobia pelagia TaxID=2841692 RepID=A0A8J6TDK2_9BACT|nr:hypothetical protein [Candidatus Desulfobia pelagia]
MSIQKKKMAAMAAVLFHLQAAEELHETSLPGSGTQHPSSASPSMWNHSSNQAQMMMRNLIQMRMVPGLKG